MGLLIWVTDALPAKIQREKHLSAKLKAFVGLMEVLSLDPNLITGHFMSTATYVVSFSYSRYC